MLRRAGRLLLVLSACALLALGGPAWAQGGTPLPAIPGYLSITGCPSAALTPCFVPYLGGNAATLNVTANAVIKASPGRVMRVVVIAAPVTTAVTINDVTTVGAAAAANTILSIPTTTAIGTVFYLDWPCLNGIVVAGITTATLAVSFN